MANVKVALEIARRVYDFVNNGFSLEEISETSKKYLIIGLVGTSTIFILLTSVISIFVSIPSIFLDKDSKNIVEKYLNIINRVNSDKGVYIDYYQVIAIHAAMYNNNFRKVTDREIENIANMFVKQIGAKQETIESIDYVVVGQKRVGADQFIDIKEPKKVTQTIQVTIYGIRPIDEVLVELIKQKKIRDTKMVYLYLKQNIMPNIKNSYANGENNPEGKQFVYVDQSELRGVPLFLQYDPRWGGMMYSIVNDPKQTIASSGCGPTSFSMAASYYKVTSKDVDFNGDGIITPNEACGYSIRKGYRTVNSGTSWGFFSDIGSNLGLNIEQCDISNGQAVIDALRGGKLVVASMTAGHFTMAGHYILLTGIDSNNFVTVNDPSSADRSNQKWSFQSIIQQEAAQYWIIFKL